MTNPAFSLNVDQILPWCGLFLMLVVARLATRGYSTQQTRVGRLTGFLARRAIDGIALIGWLADHLLQPAPNGGR